MDRELTPEELQRLENAIFQENTDGVGQPQTQDDTINNAREEVRRVRDMNAVQNRHADDAFDAALYYAARATTDAHITAGTRFEGHEVRPATTGAVINAAGLGNTTFGIGRLVEPVVPPTYHQYGIFNAMVGDRQGQVPPEPIPVPPEHPLYRREATIIDVMDALFRLMMAKDIITPGQYQVIKSTLGGGIAASAFLDAINHIINNEI